MIKKLTIKNFKSIKSLTIGFKNFNLLCGENASGKTSVIHSILSVIQKKYNQHNFDGEIIRIGSLSELKNHSSGSEITLNLIADNNKQKNVVLKPNDDLAKINKDILISDPADESIEGFEFGKNVFYISSNRMGGMDIYSKGNCILGTDGKEAISFLAEHQDDEMNQEYMDKFIKLFPDALIVKNLKLVEHVRYWMEKITNETISIFPVQHTNQFVLTFNGDNNIRPINTGSGYGFLLPILVICLGAQLIGARPCVIIENPEIYLHPKAQFALVEFFNFISQNTQLIVETHSEHILKATMDINNKSNQILLFKKKNAETVKEALTSKNFKTVPVAYCEVLYKIFGIPSAELHILLYSKLQEKYNKSKSKTFSTLKEFDDWLIKSHCQVPIKARSFRTIECNTLLTFIRNTINHPEQINPSNGKKYKYTETELKESIDFMLDII